MLQTDYGNVQDDLDKASCSLIQNASQVIIKLLASEFFNTNSNNSNNNNNNSNYTDLPILIDNYEVQYKNTIGEIISASNEDYYFRKFISVITCHTEYYTNLTRSFRDLQLLTTEANPNQEKLNASVNNFLLYIRHFPTTDRVTNISNWFQNYMLHWYYSNQDWVKIKMMGKCDSTSFSKGAKNESSSDSSDDDDDDKRDVNPTDIPYKSSVLKPPNITCPSVGGDPAPTPKCTVYNLLNLSKRRD